MPSTPCGLKLRKYRIWVRGNVDSSDFLTRAEQTSHDHKSLPIARAVSTCAGREGDDLVAGLYVNIVVMAAACLSAADDVGECCIGWVGIDVVKADISIERRKYLPDHFFCLGRVVDIRGYLGEVEVVVGG